MKGFDWLAPLGLGAIAVGLLLGAGLVGWSSGWSYLPIAIGGLAIAGWIATHISHIQQFFGLRSTQSNANILVAVAAVLVILGIINFLGARYTTEFDVSETGIAELSPQTETALRELQQPVQIVAVSTQPSPYVRQQLERYQKLNPQQFSFEFLDPQKNPVRTQDLEVTSDNTLVVVTGDRRQQLPAPAPLNFESELTPVIVQVTQSERRAIYFLQGHGELPLASPSGGPSLSQAIAALDREGYATEPLNLVEAGKIPADAAAIAIASPRRALFPAEVETLQTYLNAGGRIFLLIDPRTDAGFEPILTDWGIELEDDIIVDVSQVSQLLGFGPAVAVVTSYGDHPITQPLAQQGLMTLFPAARSLSLSGDGTAFLSSSAQSWGETDAEIREVSFDENNDLPGPLTLGVALTREVESATSESANGTAAAETSSTSEESEAGNTSEAADAGSTESTNADVENEAANESESEIKEARLVAIGNAAFAADGNFNQQGNRDLFLNAINWLTERDALISIRPKSPVNRRFSLTAQNFNGLVVLSSIVLPILALGTGFTVWWQRR
ncbi:MAG: Gldg family protein [Cyanobacteria bacterium P01_D01_bin.123]